MLFFLFYLKANETSDFLLLPATAVSVSPGMLQCPVSHSSFHKKLSRISFSSSTSGNSPTPSATWFTREGEVWTSIQSLKILSASLRRLNPFFGPRFFNPSTFKRSHDPIFGVNVGSTFSDEIIIFLFFAEKLSRSKCLVLSKSCNTCCSISPAVTKAI